LSPLGDLSPSGDAPRRRGFCALYNSLFKMAFFRTLPQEDTGPQEDTDEA
jgi:hypothetical protein